MKNYSQALAGEQAKEQEQEVIIEEQALAGEQAEEQE